MIYCTLVDVSGKTTVKKHFCHFHSFLRANIISRKRIMVGNIWWV